MLTVGFISSKKSNENRRAILPQDLVRISNKKSIYVEEGYGSTLGISDKEYEVMGASITSRDICLSCDIIVDVKLGDADYLDTIDDGKILMGWAHAVQNFEFTDRVIRKKHTVIAWEEMYEENRYIFYRNREIAGEAAILHAYQYLGKMPYETSVAIIGNGMTAKGALRILHGLGADVDVYNRKLEPLFKKKMFDYDVIVNCVLWDTTRTDRLIYKEDLKKFNKGTMIIDVSCDPELEIETSVPTTIDNPVYTVDGVIHYAVDNTPAMFPYTVSKILSHYNSEFVNSLLNEIKTELIESAIIIKHGNIIDNKITEFRKIHKEHLE